MPRVLVEKIDPESLGIVVEEKSLLVRAAGVIREN